MDKRIVAEEMIALYDWCMKSRIEIMGGKVRALGYTCADSVVATHDVGAIVDKMEVVCTESTGL